jgi:hypothetical protein
MELAVSSERETQGKVDGSVGKCRVCELPDDASETEMWYLPSLMILIRIGMDAIVQ